MKTNDLVVGHVYFFVDYYDEELLIPNIETYIYLGSNLLEENRASFYFQSARAYYKLGPWKDGVGDADEYDVVVTREDYIALVNDYEGLRQEINYVMKGGARYYPPSE